MLVARSLSGELLKTGQKIMFNQYLKSKGSARISYFPVCHDNNVTVKYKILSIKTTYR